MKTIILLLTASLSLSFAAEKKTFTGNEHVAITMEAASKFSKTKSGSIKFYFSPAEGIHINTEPMFELKLDKDSQFEINGEPAFSKNEKNYLETKNPITFSIKTKHGVAPGIYPLKGKLYYFYCSDADGWCNRYTQSIDLTITVTQ